MAETCKVSKYGDKRKSVPIPKAIEDEIEIGTEAEVYIDRKRKAVLYVFPQSDIKPPEEIQTVISEVVR